MVFRYVKNWFNYSQINESEEMKMKEYTHICKSEQEAEEGINNLKRAGFKRTQNCYWIEWWEKDNCRHIVVREF